MDIALLSCMISIGLDDGFSEDGHHTLLIGLSTNRLIQQSAYRQISNINRTTSQNLNVSRHVQQLPLCNIFKPGVKSVMEM